MSEVAVSVVRLRLGLPLPAYMSPGAAGMDLLADIDEDITLSRGERRLVPTGIAVAIPPGFEGQVRPRSGLAHREGITLLNAPGTIDADYRGELQVLLVNLGTEPVRIRRGDRIAQLVIAPVTRATWQEVTVLPETTRGAGGFGSTGTTGTTGTGTSGHQRKGEAGRESGQTGRRGLGRAAEPRESTSRSARAARARALDGLPEPK